MKKWKIASIVLTLVLLLGVFAGCSKRDEDDGGQSVADEPSAQTPAPPEEPSMGPSDDEIAADESSEDASQSEESSQPDENDEDEDTESGRIYTMQTFGGFSGFGNDRTGRVGTQSELDAALAQIAQLDAGELTTFAAEVLPGGHTKDYLLNDAQVAELVGMLQSARPTLLPEEELGNPHTGGGWTMYIDAPQGAMMISYSGWFVVEYPDQNETLIFQAEGATEPFVAINDYLWEKMDSIQ